VLAPTAEQLQALLARISKRIMNLLTGKGCVIEEHGITYLAETDSDLALARLQSAACTYRIALGPRAGQKVLSLKTVPTQEFRVSAKGCVSELGFGLHADVRCAAHQRNQLERVCRYITRPAIAINRFEYNRAGDVGCNSKARTETGLPISCWPRLTKSPGAILNNRRFARRAEGRMPGVIHAMLGCFSSAPQTQPDSN
jgi:hypothetical protein